MRTLKKIVTNPHELRTWFPPELQAGFIFLPGITQAGVGEEVCVWIELPSYRAEIYLTGLVAWRRMRHSLELPSGMGVSLRPGQVSEMTFLGRLLTGAVNPLPERLHVRTRLLAPWSCTATVPHLGKWCPALISEISRGGARLEMSMLPVHEGCQVQLNMPWHSQTMHELVLVWYQVHGGQILLGLHRESKDREQEREWDVLVDAAHRHFTSQVLIV